MLRKLQGHKDKILSLLLIEKDSLDDSRTGISETKMLNKEFDIISLGKDKNIKLWKSNSQAECENLTVSTLEFRKTAPYPLSQMVFAKVSSDPSPRFFVCSDSSNIINCMKIV